MGDKGGKKNKEKSQKQKEVKHVHEAQMQKDKQITEDELRATEARVQQLTSESIEKIDKVLAAKEAEIMEV